MATRNVIIASSAANKARKITTNATTWGELRAQSEVSELIVGDVEAIVNPGNVTLNRDDAQLPVGDFKLYLTPTKNKAGQITEGDAARLGEEIGQAIAKAVAKSNSSELQSLKEDLIDTIENYFDVNLDDADCPECEEALNEARNL